jgi:hypothetical protein
MDEDDSGTVFHRPKEKKRQNVGPKPVRFAPIVDLAQLAVDRHRAIDSVAGTSQCTKQCIEAPDRVDDATILGVIGTECEMLLDWLVSAALRPPLATISSHVASEERDHVLNAVNQIQQAGLLPLPPDLASTLAASNHDVVTEAFAVRTAFSTGRTGKDDAEALRKQGFVPRMRPWVHKRPRSDSVDSHGSSSSQTESSSTSSDSGSTTETESDSRSDSSSSSTGSGSTPAEDQ